MSSTNALHEHWQWPTSVRTEVESRLKAAGLLLEKCCVMVRHDELFSGVRMLLRIALNFMDVLRCGSLAREWAIALPDHMGMYGGSISSCGK